jgi:hypothetical protein
MYTIKSNIILWDNGMFQREIDFTKPFIAFLKLQHLVPLVESDATTPAACALQKLVDLEDRKGYESLCKQYEDIGLNFRLTDGVVYQVEDVGNQLGIQIAVQVKGQSITWYFWGNGVKDQYPQAFRDILFKAASDCHQEVENGCDLYYRGSNALHVKTMHTKEDEANMNHNHYRCKQDVTPNDFKQHLQAFLTHESHDFFFLHGETKDICDAYELHYHLYTKPREELSGYSYKNMYRCAEEQRLEEADVIEFCLFGEQQEPCRINETELKIDYDCARRKIELAITRAKDASAIELLEKEIAHLKSDYEALLAYRLQGGIRALGAERIMTRQVKGSSLPVQKATLRDDSVGAVPKIPEWAISLINKVSKAKTKMQKQLADEARIATATSALSSLQKPDDTNPSANPSQTISITQAGLSLFDQKSKDLATPSQPKTDNPLCVS